MEARCQKKNVYSETFLFLKEITYCLCNYVADFNFDIYIFLMIDIYQDI